MVGWIDDAGEDRGRAVQKGMQLKDQIYVGDENGRKGATNGAP